MYRVTFFVTISPGVLLSFNPLLTGMRA